MASDLGSRPDAGLAGHEFTIMSVSEPFVFALVAELLGPDGARERLGADATGLPSNSLAAIERSADGRTNPMVNAGAIATTSLAPGTTTDDRGARGCTTSACPPRAASAGGS